MQKRQLHIRRSAAAAGVLLLLFSAIALSGCGSGGSGGTTPSGTTARGTPSGSQASFKFIVCGDPQNNYEVFDKVLAAAKSVDFLIIAGDLTGSGTATEFSNFMDTMRASGIRFYSVPGNHDVATTPVEAGYGRYVGPPHSSFDFKNTHFLLIDNSTPSLGFYPAERQWASADLKAAGAKGFEHIIAIAHVPPMFPYSAKATKDQIAGIDANEQLVPVLKAGGAEELFCGHVHTYQQDTEDGLRITITGGAGAPLLGLDSYHNYVLVEVNGRSMSQKVVRI
jgi:Icc-related predicted phosphoesterase